MANWAYLSIRPLSLILDLQFDLRMGSAFSYFLRNNCLIFSSTISFKDFAFAYSFIFIFSFSVFKHQPHSFIIFSWFMLYCYLSLFLSITAPFTFLISYDLYSIFLSKQHQLLIFAKNYAVSSDIVYSVNHFFLNKIRQLSIIIHIFTVYYCSN